MYAVLSLVVCLAGQPAVCETVIPDLVHPDTGQPPTLFECVGSGGQDIARSWLEQHPGYLLRRIQCSIANDPIACATESRRHAPEAPSAPPSRPVRYHR